MPVNTAIPVFDAMLFTGKPSPASLGMYPTRLAYGTDLWGRPLKNLELVPTDKNIMDFLAATAGKGHSVILDIEGDQWAMYPGNMGADGKGWSPAIETASIGKFKNVVDRVRALEPGVSVGIYDQFPERDFWRATRVLPSYKAWQAENTTAISAAKAMDILYPSLYTFYAEDNPDAGGSAAWVTYATANISEARRVNPGKPVIPFLWPQYEDDKPTVQYTLIDAVFWRLQLDTMRKLADGVVIWGGIKDAAGGGLPWNGSAPWWVATQAFISDLKGMGAPAIIGIAQVGHTLTANTGTWKNSPTSFAYQWYRAGVPISGATASTYVLVAGDVGYTLTVWVTATNSGGSSVPTTSAPTTVVLP